MKNQRTYRLLFLVLAVVGLTADLTSKYGVFAWLSTEPYKFEVIPGVFSLVAQRDHTGLMVNQGALFGLMQERGNMANLAFAAISFLAAVGIVVWMGQHSTAIDRGLCLALGLILAGTLGNLYDRIFFGGVRDFLHWRAPDWPVFNVADCCLVMGAGLLLFQAFRAQPQSTPQDSLSRAQPVGAAK